MEARARTAPSREQVLCDTFNWWELDAVDQRLLRHIADFPAATTRELAALVNMTAGGLWKRIQRPKFRKAMSELLKTTEDIIRRAQRASAFRMVGIANSKNDEIALEAAKLLLKPMLAERHEVNVNQRVIFKTRIGDGGRIIQDVEAEPIDVTPKTKRYDMNGNLLNDAGEIANPDDEGIPMPKVFTDNPFGGKDDKPEGESK